MNKILRRGTEEQVPVGGNLLLGSRSNRIALFENLLIGRELADEAGDPGVLGEGLVENEPRRKGRDRNVETRLQSSQSVYRFSYFM